MNSRGALLIRCSQEEADTIRWEARREYRSISAYVLYILQRTLQFEQRLFSAMGHSQAMNRVLALTPLRPVGPRTAILLRCSAREAQAIRLAASRRGIPISSFVLHSLRRAWQITSGVRPADKTVPGMGAHSPAGSEG